MSTLSPTSVEEDVLRIKKKLDKMMKLNEIDVNISMDMLNALKKLPVDLTVLKNTGIGVVLNNLRKSCNSDELGALTKGLLKNWKKLVSSEATTNNSSHSSPPEKEQETTETFVTTQKMIISETTTTTIIEEQPAAPAVVLKLAQKRPNKLVRHISYTETKDLTRLKCRELLAGALELTEPIENDTELLDCVQIAGCCEDAIWSELKNTDMKYKNRIRSRVANLKDAKNPNFRENVRLGIITPQRLAIMTSDEMASKELKELRAKFTKEAIDDHQMARKMASSKSVLTCGKCKKNNVTYTEMQTRSSDEPMTVFAQCLECGNRWRM